MFALANERNKFTQQLLPINHLVDGEGKGLIFTNSSRMKCFPFLSGLIRRDGSGQVRAGLAAWATGHGARGDQARACAVTTITFTEGIKKCVLS